MIYTDLTKKAMQIAYKAHAGAVDKSGVPYIFHPSHLAEQMETEHEVIVALLHDVVEDSDITMEDLAAAGFPQDVLDAIRLLTRDKETPYLEYIAHLKENPLAKKVKMADLRHNSDVTRLEGIDAEAGKRLKKYGAALQMLQNDEYYE